MKKRLEAAGFSTEVKPIRSVAIPIERQECVVARRWPAFFLMTCSPHFGSPL